MGMGMQVSRLPHCNQAGLEDYTLLIPAVIRLCLGFGIVSGKF
jgi:hypothetical protein